MLTPSQELVTMREPDSVAAEAFRILRTNISLRDFDKKIKVINVISAMQSESKSTTVLNLAYVYSQLGLKVLTIDLDLRLPTFHKKLLIRNKAGITDIIGGRVRFEDAIVHYTENLDVLLSGTKIPFAAEFIESDMLKKFLEVMRNNYDIVFIDCPPINVVADGVITSSLCDGTVFCIASGKNDKKDLQRAKDIIEYADMNILGIVMTRVKPEHRGYYGYNYGYYGKYSYTKKK